jgi:hypothetical protein
MPPKSRQNSKNSAEQEGRNLLAISAIESKQITQIAEAARLYNVPVQLYATDFAAANIAMKHAQIIISYLKMKRNYLYNGPYRYIDVERLLGYQIHKKWLIFFLLPAGLYLLN